MVGLEGQVAGMLQRYLKIPDEDMPRELDATDGS